MSTKTTFPEIIKNKICIPIIQRDYVQGLKESKNESVRKKLIKDIFLSLKEKDISKSPHDLGMIYGSLDGLVFYPFDGQQRLTTLWLLSLYLTGKMLFLKKGVNEDFSNELKENFNYDIRKTTIDFIDIIKILFLENYETLFSRKEDMSISMFIKNKHEYYGIYDSDPTIVSILGVLDSIDSFYKETILDNSIDILYNNLFNDSHIYFNYLKLDDYSMTDDIYIKLNARGLPLTDFENLKAKIIGIIKNYEEKNNISKSIIDDFSAICDIKWEDDFYFDKNTEKELSVIAYNIDEKRINFIKNFFVNYWFVYTNENPRQKEWRTITEKKFKISNEEFSINVEQFFSTSESTNEECVYECVKKLITLDSLKNVLNSEILNIYKNYSFSNIELKVQERMKFYSLCEYIILNEKIIKNKKEIYNDFYRYNENLFDDMELGGGNEEYVSFIKKTSELFNKNIGKEICKILNLQKLIDVDIYSFNSTLKSNYISEVLKNKVTDNKKKDEIIKNFGEHCAFVYEFLGCFNNISHLFNESYPNDYTKQINTLKKYIKLQNRHLVIDSNELRNVQKEMVKGGMRLPYPGSGFTFGRNADKYDSEQTTFDCLLRLYDKENNFVQKRQGLYDIMRGNAIASSNDICDNIIYSNLAYLTNNELEKGFRFVFNKVLVFTTKKVFSGYCYDFILYTKAIKEKEDVENNSFWGAQSGWNEKEFIIGKDVYKTGKKIGEYVINGTTCSLLNNKNEIV